MESKTINLWDEMMKNPNKSFKRYKDKEEKFIKENISKGDTVLDLGCGTGRTIKIIAPLCKEVIGIDNDEEAVERGQDNIKELNNSKLILEDAEETNFSDNYFDKIFIGLTFVNFGDTKTKILSEIKRILKKDGKLIFSVYNENSLNARLENYEKYDKGNYKVDEKGNLEFTYGAVSEQFTKEQITEILEQAGFEILDIDKEDIFYLIKAKIKS